MTGVIGNDDTGRRWRVGELARAARMTVRALYHYDEIGLLTASERTASGHRRYTERDLRRLYRIRTLRALGLPLRDIAGVLSGSENDLATMRDLLAAQLRGLDERAARIHRLKYQISGLLAQLDQSSMPDPHQFMTTLEMMSMFENSFTQEQREQLVARTAALGPEAVEAAKREWGGLVEQLMRHVREDTPVTDPEVQELVGRWDALGDRFHGGDEQIKAKAQAMWEQSSEELSRNMPWPADQMRELVGYVQRARQSG